MGRLANLLEQELLAARQQARDVPMINPPLVLAERLSKDMDRSKLSLQDIEDCLAEFTRRALLVRATDARKMLKVDPDQLETQQRAALQAYRQQSRKWQYNLVFTAHPIFAFSPDVSQDLAGYIADQSASLPDIAPLQSITLAEEHARAMIALTHARAGLLSLNRTLLMMARETDADWQETQPVAMNMATWVGYDLDGRDDIRWVDSFCFRLEEKQHILAYYLQRLQVLPSLSTLYASVQKEFQATSADIVRFRAYQQAEGSLAEAANALTQRSDKVVDIVDWTALLGVFAAETHDQDQALEALLLRAEMQQYGLGVGEIHLRLNALQVRNAMRSVDGRGVSESRGETSRRLMDVLSRNIGLISPEEINFHDLDTERATAGRLMMLSRQILKHVDGHQPIRLLVAECERPLTLLSALYLAKLYSIADRLDISPLFETRLGLERGAEVIEQLMQNPRYLDYVQERGRLSIQTGFSDAGRFIGQLPATLAIERLQLKLVEVHRKYLNADVALLVFNTHGESMGRGGARGSVQNRQQYIFSPHARKVCDQRQVPVIHESAFQGGDGYVWFHHPTLAAFMILRLLEAEFDATPYADDPFYAQSDFSLDFFLSIKNWQDKLFANPDYGSMLDMFGSNMLPKAGSRPTKRASSSMGSRQDPSKIRAIAHNARLQQSGYLINVIGGLGHASTIDLDRFVELYEHSPRLRLLVRHANEARKLGSTATLLAYGALFRRSFWIGRAYQAGAESEVRTCRKIADALYRDTNAEAIDRLVTVFRDDLLDFNAFQKRLGLQSDYREDRVLIDSLQVLRLVLIMETMAVVGRVPRFAESGATGHADIMRLALRLDIESVVNIIEREFALDTSNVTPEDFDESGRPASQEKRYQAIESRVIIPLKRIHRMLLHVTLVIGCLYSAHG